MDCMPDAEGKQREGIHRVMEDRPRAVLGRMAVALLMVPNK